MKSNIKFLLFCALLTAFFCLSGCQKNQNASNGANPTGKRIGVTLLTREHQFYRDMEAGLRDAAQKRGYELIVTSGDFDLAKQQSQIDNFIVQKVDVIIVCPADSKGIAPAIARASDAKIPVFTADIAAQNAKVVSHIASDNLAGGRLAADYIAKLLKDEGNVGIIGQQEVQSALDRETGFKEELQKHPNVKIISVLNGGGVRDRALKAAEDMLQGNPNLKAIFAINDDTALGTLSAAEARGRSDLVIVGYDATPEALKAIGRNSSLKADVAQQPRVIGTKTIEAIAAHFGGGQVEPNIVVPVKVVDAETLKNGG